MKTITVTKLVKFLLKYPDNWHSFASDYETVSTVCACQNLGILSVNDHNQMRLKSASKAQRYLTT